MTPSRSRPSNAAGHLRAALRRTAVAALGLMALALAPAALAPTAPAQAETAAADPDGALAFIDKLADDAIAVWTDTNLTGDERQSTFRQLLYEGFYVTYISRLVLGRHRRTASPEQMSEYETLFPDYIINVFAARIGEYSNERFQILGTAPAGKRDVFVRSNILRPSAPPIATDWRVRKVGDEFKIVDLKVEGISMVVTQRDEFASKINQVGLEGLLDELRDKARVASASGTQSTNSAADRAVQP